MGNFLFIGGSEKPGRVDLFLDFERAEPQDDEERVIYDAVEAVLERSPLLLEQLANYTGCQEIIRKAIAEPNPENEEQAWLAVLPAVEQSKQFYEYSLELQKCFPTLLSALCRDNPREHLEMRQALVKQLAHVFDFALRFDDLKMMNPALQNDYSYYRRALNRMKLSKKYQQTIIIKDELAARLSLFLAYPTPLMNTLTETASEFLSPSVPLSNVSTTLALMCTVCEDMVANKRFNSVETNMFCLRCMTAGIVLFDSVHPQGAFYKKSGIPIRACITLLKTYDTPGSGVSSTEGLVNVIRFTTTHLHDPETPNEIKRLLE